jgi:UDP-2,3-diacylglucosamine pyrophosphatase LpxH
MKVCSACHTEKDDSEFYPGSNRCKSCTKAWVRTYYKEHKAEHDKRVKDWRKRNADKVRANNKKYISKERSKNYYLQHKRELCEKVKVYRRNRYKTDPLFRLSIAVRSIVRRAIKTQRTEQALGCTFAEFKSYIESKFTEGMTWDNFGKHGWHVDHIRPLSWFDVTDPNQVLVANHFSNLQPKWACDNWSKNNRHEG